MPVQLRERVASTIFAIFVLPGSFIVSQEQSILAAINGTLLHREGPPVPAGRIGLYYRTNHLYIGMVDAAGVLLFMRKDRATIATNLLAFFHPGGPPTYLGQTLRIP
ncbi:MAG: hypothetical protein ACYDHH_15645 [Solirubrobacteraceae bacterium]